MKKNLKTNLRRMLSVLLSVLMLVSACAVAFPAAFAGLTVGGSLPTFTFYVPETIYLKPSDNQTFQYYVDRGQSVGGALRTGSNTTGNIYFNCSGATAVTGLTCSGATVNLSATTSGSGTLSSTVNSGSLSSAISMNATTQISWTVTFTYNGESYSATSYSECYAPNRNVTANGATGYSGYSDQSFASTLIYIQGAQTTARASWTGEGSSENYTYYQNVSGTMLDPLVKGVSAPGNCNPQAYGTSDSTVFTGATNSSNYCRCVRNDGYCDKDQWVMHVFCNRTPAEITVDTSRYTNTNQIPNLKLGFIVTDRDHSNKRRNAYVSDATSQVTNPNDLNSATLNYTGDYGGTTTVDLLKHSRWRKDAFCKALYSQKVGTVLWGTASDGGDTDTSCGKKYSEPIGYAVSGSNTTTYRYFRGAATGAQSDSYAMSTSLVILKVNTVDKGNLRTLVNSCVGQYMDGYYTDIWTLYENRLKQACEALGNPKATPTEVEYAEYNLNAAKDALVRATGTATVTHQSATGAALGTDSKPYNYGETVTASANSYNGYDYTSANPTTLSFKNVKSDTKDWTLTYTPTDYTITYNTDGGDAIAAKTYNIESTDQLPEPTKTGNTFDYWYTASNSGTWATGTEYAKNTSLTNKYGDVTLKAHWTIHSSTLRVFPYPGTWQGTEEWTAIDRDYGEDYTPGNPTPPTGYHFTGWTLKSSDDEAEPNGTFENGTYLFGPADGALDILEANYEINNYAVTLNSDGTGYTVTTAPAANVNHGSDVTFAITLDEGYSNSEIPACTATNADTVTSSQSGNVITYTVPNVTGATTITLGGATINTYNVTVTAGTGTTITGIEAGSYNHGTTFTVIAAATQGYDQSTPVLKVNGTPITSGDTITLTGDIAVTTDDLSLNTYNVTFTPAVDGGYAVATAPAATVTHGGSVTFAITLDTPYTQATPTATATVGSVTPNKDGAQVTYTVTDITADTTITVDAAAINTYPVAFGTAENGGYAVTTAPAATVTHGGSVTFVLELDDSHSQATPTATATVGTVTPTKDGSVVTYTVSNITGGTEISVNAAAINEYTVCYYNENGDLIVGVPVQDGVVPTAPTAPEKAPDSAKHYTFAGWKADNAGDPIPTADLPAASSSSCKAYYAAYTGTAHTYTTAPTWGEWTEDETTVWTCVATFKCDNCAYSTNLDVTVTPTNYEATYATAAYTTYTASSNGFSQTKAYTVPVDKTKLAADLATYSAKLAETDKYTADSLALLQTEVTAAQNLLDNTSAEAQEADKSDLISSFETARDNMANVELVLRQYNVTVTAGEGTAISGVEAGTYDYGTAFTVTASATEGYDQSAPVLKVNGNVVESGSNVEVVGDTAITTEDLSKNKYTVTWMNGGTGLETDENVEHGAEPSYDGTEPDKTALDYVYTFLGWNTDANAVEALATLPAVTADTVYFAIFSRAEREYSVRWIYGAQNTLQAEETLGYTHEFTAANLPAAFSVSKDDSQHTTYSWASLVGNKVSDFLDEQITEVVLSAAAEDANHTGDVAYTWVGSDAEGYTACTAALTCDACGAEITETAENEAFTKQAANVATDCSQHNTYNYTATFSNGLFATQSKNDVQSAETGPHDFTKQIIEDAYKNTDASCTAKATYFYACSVCNEKGTETFEYGEMLPHDFTKQIIEDAYKNTDATCTAKATYFYACSVCNEKGTTTFEYGEKDLANHATTDTYTENAKEPGYTFKGYTGDRYCVACHALVAAGQDIDKLDLNANAAIIKANKINNDAAALPGSYDEADLAEMNEKLNAVTSAAAIDDNEDAVLAALAALTECVGNITELETYTVTFLVDGSQVKEEVVFAGSDATPPAQDELINNGANHKRFSGWTGSYTNVSSDVTVTGSYTEEAHNWTDSAITLVPTCMATGKQAQVCACGATGEKTLEKDANNHTGNNTTSRANEVPATCTAPGSYDEIVTCECGVQLSSTPKTIEQLAHSFTSYVFNDDATCIADGTETATCTGCGLTDTRTVVGSKLGHDWSAWTTTAEATCTSAGSRTRSCGRCDTVETETIAKLPHTDENGDTICDICGNPTEKHTHTDENFDNTCDTCAQVIDTGFRCSWCNRNAEVQAKGNMFLRFVYLNIHTFVHVFESIRRFWFQR